MTRKQKTGAAPRPVQTSPIPEVAQASAWPEPTDAPLPPLALTEDRTPEQQIADGDRVLLLPAAVGTVLRELEETSRRLHGLEVMLEGALDLAQRAAGVPPAPTGPVVPAGGSVVTLDAVWTERLAKMAQAMGIDPQRAVLELLARQWIAARAGIRKDEG